MQLREQIKALPLGASRDQRTHPAQPNRRIHGRVAEIARPAIPELSEHKLRSVAEYLERAAEFEVMAASTGVDVLRKRYADIAACYRLLAKDREWLIGTGAIGSEQHGGGQEPSAS